MMRERIINGRVQQYLERTLSGETELLKRIMEEQIRYRNTGWINTTLKHMKEVNISLQQLDTIENKEQVKEKIKTWDTDQWRQEVESKSTLEILHKRYKESVKEEHHYANRPSSNTWCRARTNCLPLYDRKRHKNQDAKCSICNLDQEEDLEHFLLHRAAYQDIRKKNSTYNSLTQKINRE